MLLAPTTTTFLPSSEMLGRARRENRAADDESADIIEMKAIYVLVGRYGAQKPRHIERRRQRKLNQNAMNARILVELGNFFDNNVLFHICRIIVTERLDAGVGAGADLFSDIEARSRIASDLGQSRGRAGLRDDTVHSGIFRATALPSMIFAVILPAFLAPLVLGHTPRIGVKTVSRRFRKPQTAQ